MRAVMDAAGITDIVTKAIGSTNPHNLIKATFRALSQIQGLDYVARKRGKEVDEILARVRA